MAATVSRSVGVRFGLLCGATLFQFIAMGIFLSALPLFVTGELGGSRSQVGLAVGAFSLSAVLLRPSVGREIDRRGRRLFLVAAPLILMVTSAGFGLARAVPVAVLLRLGQGVAGACFYTAAATVATDLAPEGRRAEYLARFSLFLYGGLAIGPALGEAMVSSRGFGWTWAAAATSAAVSLAVALCLPETQSPDAGAAMAGGSPPGGLARFLHPAAVGPGVVIITAAVGYTAITAYSPLYARRIGMATSGALYATFALTVLVIRLVSGRLADRYGRVAVALPGMMLAACGLTVLALQVSPTLAFVGVAGFGAGFSLVFPALMALTVDRVPERERGAAVGSFTAFFDIGSSTGGYAVGAVADHWGFGGAYGLPAGLCVVGAVVLARLGRKVRAEAEALADEAPLPEPSGT
jgi:MFS family permease